MSEPLGHLTLTCPQAGAIGSEAPNLNPVDTCATHARRARTRFDLHVTADDVAGVYAPRGPSWRGRRGGEGARSRTQRHQHDSSSSNGDRAE